MLGMRGDFEGLAGWVSMLPLCYYYYYYYYYDYYYYNYGTTTTHPSTALITNTSEIVCRRKVNVNRSIPTHDNT